MSPDFVLLRGSTSVEDALNAVRHSEISAELLTTIFVCSPQDSLEGSVPVAALLRADPAGRLESVVKHETPSLSPEASFEEVARLMADYNLTSIPVADENGRMLGVVTVDDLLAAMIPRSWRRRFGLLGED
jgi:Mg/Co/Ni transporter MgtE